MSIARGPLRWRAHFAACHAVWRPGSTTLCRLSTSAPATLEETTSTTVLDTMEQRGLVAQITSRGLRSHLDLASSPPRTVYLGIDPTAQSLHVGNLLAVIGLLHFVLAGHRAVALVGGATGSIGDPSGRSSERPLLSPAELAANIAAIRAQFARLMSTGLDYARERTWQGKAKATAEDQPRVEVVNNQDWLKDVTLLDFLRTVGKRARVSTMLARESVASRLSSPSGISYTEFTYQLLQAYDFAALRERQGVTVQLGGSDQWGNIMGGIDLMRKISASGTDQGEDLGGEDRGEGVYGLTMPLLTTSDGAKFGKSAGNAIWLDPALTPPVDLFQAFLRTSDSDVEKYLQLLTFVPLDEITSVMTEHKAAPEQRKAQHLLASEIVNLVHGPGGLHQAELATSILFHKPLLRSLPVPSLLAAFQGSPHLVSLAKSSVLDSTVVDLLVTIGLATSRSEAKKAVAERQITFNHVRVADPTARLASTLGEETAGRMLMLVKQGKARYKLVELF